jgi:hypothetical protein
MRDVVIGPGDIIKLAPRDPAFWMMATGMLVVEEIVPPNMILCYGGDYNLIDFKVVYLNGRDLTDRSA